MVGERAVRGAPRRPEFAHRLLADEARDAGKGMSNRTAWRIASVNGWWSVFGKKKARGKGRKAGPPVHDDLVQRKLTANAANRLWLTDITEHKTAEGKLYLCAIKDVFSNKIAGYSISSRMKSRLVVNAIDNAVALRGDDRLRRPFRQGKSISLSESDPRVGPSLYGRIDRQSRCCGRQRGDGELIFTPAEERLRPPLLGHPRRAAHRERDLDRMDLPPPTPTRPAGPIDPRRVRDHDDQHPGARG